MFNRRIISSTRITAAASSPFIILLLFIHVKGKFGVKPSKINPYIPK